MTIMDQNEMFCELPTLTIYDLLLFFISSAISCVKMDYFEVEFAYIINNAGR